MTFWHHHFGAILTGFTLAFLIYLWLRVTILGPFSNLDVIPRSWTSIGYTTTNLKEWRKFLRGIKRHPEDYVIRLRQEAAAVGDRPGLVALIQRLRDLDQIFFSAGVMVTTEIIAERRLLEDRLATLDQARTSTRTKARATKKKVKEEAKAKVVSRYARLLKDD